MSLKTCLTLLPGLIKTAKHGKINKLNTLFLNVARRPEQIILFSTDKKSSNIRNYKEIYYGVLTPQVRAVKVCFTQILFHLCNILFQVFSLSSSIIGITCQPFLYEAVVSTGSVPIIVAAYSFIGFFTFLTPFLLHLITKKYVTQLLYKRDTDSYVAKTVNFFNITREVFKIFLVIVYISTLKKKTSQKI
jgi:hypothetical protein